MRAVDHLGLVVTDLEYEYSPGCRAVFPRDADVIGLEIVPARQDRLDGP